MKQINLGKIGKKKTLRLSHSRWQSILLKSRKRIILTVNGKMMYSEKDRPYLVDYARRHLADLIPYSDPNYEERLQEWAESYAESEINPNPEFEEYMNSLCEEHDNLLDDSYLDEL